ncbi:MAG TPA: methionyl-tRNA formyltransferase [Ktedonobacteraceae bacterium]
MAFTSLPSMRIIYFSNQPPEVVNAVIEGLEALGQQVLLLVTTPGPRARPSTEYQRTVANARRDLDILVTNHMSRLAGMLRTLEPDLIFTTGFSWKLPPELLALPRLGAVNGHPSLLPRYRGPNPLFWQFMNGEAQGGLTMHRMDADFDTGNILVQRAVEIAPDDDIDSFFPKLAAAGGPMIAEMLQAVAAGLPGTPQPVEGASYAPLCTDVERRLDWTRPAWQLRNQVRGWGNQGALATIDGQTYLVCRARAIVSATTAQPGVLLESTDNTLLVQTAEGALLIGDFKRVT